MSFFQGKHAHLRYESIYPCHSLNILYHCMEEGEYMHWNFSVERTARVTANTPAGLGGDWLIHWWTTGWRMAVVVLNVTRDKHPNPRIGLWTRASKKEEETPQILFPSIGRAENYGHSQPGYTTYNSAWRFEKLQKREGRGRSARVLAFGKKWSGRSFLFTEEWCDDHGRQRKTLCSIRSKFASPRESDDTHLFRYIFWVPIHSKQQRGLFSLDSSCFWFLLMAVVVLNGSKPWRKGTHKASSWTGTQNRA